VARPGSGYNHQQALQRGSSSDWKVDQWYGWQASHENESPSSREAGDASDAAARNPSDKSSTSSDKGSNSAGTLSGNGSSNYLGGKYPGQDDGGGGIYDGGVTSGGKAGDGKFSDATNRRERKEGQDFFKSTDFKRSHGPLGGLKGTTRWGGRHK